MAKCRYCNNTGKIPLLTSVVDCDCIKRSVESSLTCVDNSGPRDFASGSDLINGWYSATVAGKRGSVVYLHAVTGKEVEITEISSQSEPCSQWPDLKFVGIIDKTKYVRGGMR